MNVMEIFSEISLYLYARDTKLLLLSIPSKNRYTH